MPCTKRISPRASVSVARAADAELDFGLVRRRPSGNRVCRDAAERRALARCTEPCERWDISASRAWRRRSWRTVVGVDELARAISPTGGWTRRDSGRRACSPRESGTRGSTRRQGSRCRDPSMRPTTRCDVRSRPTTAGSPQAPSGRPHKGGFIQEEAPEVSGAQGKLGRASGARGRGRDVGREPRCSNLRDLVEAPAGRPAPPLRGGSPDPRGPFSFRGGLRPGSRSRRGLIELASDPRGLSAPVGVLRRRATLGACAEIARTELESTGGAGDPSLHGGHPGHQDRRAR